MQGNQPTCQQLTAAFKWLPATAPYALCPPPLLLLLIQLLLAQLLRLRVLLLQAGCSEPVGHFLAQHQLLPHAALVPRAAQVRGKSALTCARSIADCPQ